MKNNTPKKTFKRSKESNNKRNLARPEPVAGKLFDNQIEVTDLISAKELAKRLNVAHSTVQGWRYKGYIPNNCMIKVGPKTVRYRWSEVQRWLRATGDQQ